MRKSILREGRELSIATRKAACRLDILPRVNTKPLAHPTDPKQTARVHVP